MQKAEGHVARSASFLPAAHCLLLTAFDYPSSTNNLVAAIEHGRLSGCDRALRFIELNANTIIVQRSEGRRRSRVTIAHAHFSANRFGRVVESNPVNSGGSEFLTQQIFVITDDHLILSRVDGQDIERPGLGHADAAALTNRVSMNAGMRPDDFSIAGNDVAAAWQPISLLFGCEV